MINKKILVSVIVPVYNLYPYLNKALNSIVNQTYGEIEIIIINDGSTDQTRQLCLEWIEKDERIVYIEKKNEGQGVAKNLGVYRAQGEYIAFVDGDDWIAPDYIEKLLETTLQYQSDICICDYYTWSRKTNVYKENRSEVLFENTNSGEVKKRIIYSFPAILCRIIFRKQFLVDNIIYMPGIPYEDTCVFPEIILLAESISYCQECLYYYWSDRDDSTTNSKQVAGISGFIQIIPIMLKNLSVKNILCGNEIAIEGYVSKRAYKMFDKIELLEDRLQSEVKEELNNMMDKYYPERIKRGDKTALILGSFNSRWIYNKYLWNKKKRPTHFAFTSLIAQYLGEETLFSIKHSNMFRELAIRYDLEKKFAKDVEENQYQDILMIDFMEEHYDICLLEDNSYITRSDAFLDAEIHGIKKIKKIIKSGSEEYLQLWMKACQKFIKVLTKKWKNKKVVLLKTALTTGYGKYCIQNKYERQSEICLFNKTLKFMEEFFIRNFPAAEIIQITDELVFTDIDEKYGRTPFLMNSYYYAEGAWQLRNILHFNGDEDNVS